MRLIELNIKNRIKRVTFIYHFYKKLQYIFYKILAILALSNNVNIIRNGLRFGVEPKYYKKIIRKIIFRDNLTNNEIYLLISILNSLGYVFIGKHILKRMSRFDIKSSTRVFTRECLSAFGHIALLDIFVKAKLLNYQSYHCDYIDSESPELAIQFFGRYFNCIDNYKKDRVYVENYNYTHLNNNFILLDEFNSKVQMDFQKKFNVNVIELKELNYSSSGDSNWYVCIHVRDSSDEMTNLRSAKIDTYFQAFHLLLLKGGMLYRIFDNGSVSQICNINGKLIEKNCIINTVGQLELIAGCRFFIGTGSGPINMASHVLGRPVLSTNWAPLGCRLSWPDQVILPKRFIKVETGEALPYSKRLKGCFSRVESELRLHDLGYQCIDNSAHDIAVAINEMLDATEYGNFDSDFFLRSDLQQRFYKIISNHGRLIPIFIGKDYSDKYEKEII